MARSSRCDLSHEHSAKHIHRSLVCFATAHRPSQSRVDLLLLLPICCPDLELQLLILLVNLILTTYTMVGTGFWLLSPLLPLTADYSAPKRLAVSLIVACLSVARSPSSAIAVITELGAHGAYTSATLSITVLTDIVVVRMYGLPWCIVLPSPGFGARQGFGAG
eukprot:scaffold10417_cov33-Tisochrysis_lutea.AAC.4